MAGSGYMRSPFSLAKRLKVAPPQISSQVRTVYQSRQPWHNLMGLDPRLSGTDEQSAKASETFAKATDDARGILLPTHEFELPEEVQTEVDALRLPRAVQLTYLAPLRRQPTHKIPTADLQLRSYSSRNLEFMADFAMRAAYYLKLPARGPIPLPRIVERYTVPKSNFIFKKSQENFERITLRRLIQIQDGHPEVVQIWLGFLNKYQYYGVGMKANVWDWSGTEVGKEMDQQTSNVAQRVRERLEMFGRRKDLTGNKETNRMINDDLFKGAYGALGPLGSKAHKEA